MTTSQTVKWRSSGTSNAVRVLFVDDSPSTRDSAQVALEAAGYSVAVAADGFQALGLVVQWHPDVVLADIALPRLDGYQMCALMKSNSDYQGIPVIMLSSRDALFDRERAGLVGSDSHVVKPLSTQVLTDALASVGIEHKPDIVI